MQATANPTGTSTNAPADQETRPVRLLVPTVRRSDYWLPLNDTLRAHDLGVTRHTSDEDLADRVNAAADMLLGVSTEDPAAYLHRIRDGLRHPRDITEAREWGFHVPVTEVENKEEVLPKDKQRLGWWWIYDPERVETRVQREARYLNDHRLVDMKGIARLWSRAYITVKDLKFWSDQIRKVLNDTDNFRTDLVRQISGESGVPKDLVEAALLDTANRDILKAMCPRRDRAGQSDLWYVSDALKNGRDLGRIDEWYEYAKIRQTGRPRGSKTRTRATAPS